MNEKLEQWLTLRDKNTGKYVKQIKLDSNFVTQDDLGNYFLSIQNMIDGIDFKFMTLIKSSIAYHFQGLIDIHNGGSFNPLQIKYELHSELLKLINATIIDLRTKVCNPHDIKKIINAILNIYNASLIIKKDIKGGTSNQALIIEEQIDTMIKMHNGYLAYLEDQYNRQKHCLNFMIPQNWTQVLQISSALDTTNFNIEKVKKLYIEVKELS